MDNSVSAAVDHHPQQQQQQHTTQKTKKKSKNKKQSGKQEIISSTTSDTIATSNHTINTTSTTTLPQNITSNGKVQETSTSVIVNGLSKKLKRKLYINENNGECSHKANGIMTENSSEGGDCLLSLNGHHTPPATDAINGQCEMSINHNKNHKHNTKEAKHCQLHTAPSSSSNNSSRSTADVGLSQKSKIISSTPSLENGYNHYDSEEIQNIAVDEVKKEQQKEKEEEEENVSHTDLSNCKQNAIMDNIKSDHVNVANYHEESISSSTHTTTANQKANNNSETPSDLTSTSLEPALDLSNVHIEYKEYESELQMHDIMHLIQAELSEPYSIYTYRYFIYNWPKLCFLAAHGNEYVGAIVCKLDMHMNARRGYIAMLAVRKEYRKLKIGTTLVQKAIEAMLADNADEVVLETEMRNVPALRLYENLGFVRDKRLFRYYLNGVDALRLKLWFR